MMMPALILALLAAIPLIASAIFNTALAQEENLVQAIPAMLDHPASWLALGIFIIAYVLVVFEEKTELKKSKPVLVAAGLVWVLVSWVVSAVGTDPETLHDAVSETIEDYGSLLLFLLAAMTYISALQERQVFDALRSRLLRGGYSYKKLFWMTGTLAFFISPFADNMTTALVCGAVVMALIKDNYKLVALMLINVVNAANAGGAFSAFGDITSLMVWQAGKIAFFDFFVLFLPCVACFVIPAAVMTFAIPAGHPEKQIMDVPMKRGAKRIIALGLFTIVLAVMFEQIFQLPSFMGMMTGLGLLMTFGYYLKSSVREDDFDVYKLMDDTEWDTLLFFFGVIFCISGLGFLGYLEVASGYLFGGFGNDKAVIIIGIISALIDNIPLMFAAINMNPDMTEFHWLLLTLTLGTGGSLLSIGSAAGVALMGVSKGQYTFMSHLRWTPVLALGYVAAIFVHYMVNGDMPR